MRLILIILRLKKIDGSRYVNTSIQSAGKIVQLWSDISIDDISSVIVENSELKKFVLNFENELELHCVNDAEKFEERKKATSVFTDWVKRVNKEVDDYFVKHFGKVDRKKKGFVVMNRIKIDDKDLFNHWKYKVVEKD